MNLSLKLIIFQLVCCSFLFLSAAQCRICQMEVKSESKIKFETLQKDKKVRFCSFSCVAQFHQKYPTLKISATDYLNQKAMDTKDAFFLVRSQNLLKEFEFDMPPTVALFATREDAEKTQKRLGDGKILVGFDAAEKEYR